MVKLKSGFGLDALSVALNRFSVRGAQFVTTIIIARMLGPEGRGLVSALSVPSQLAVTLSEMGIRQSTAFYLGKKIYPVERLIPTLLAMIPIAGLFAMTLSLLYLNYADVAHGDWLLRGVAVASIPLLLIVSYSTGVFLGQQRIAEFRKANWRPALANLVLVVLLCWVFRFGVMGVMIATLAAAVLGATYALWLLRKEGPLRLGFDSEIAKALQRKGLSYALALFVVTLNYKVMILLLTRFSTLDQVGLYSQATVIAELIWEMPTAISSLLLSRGVNAQDPDAFSRKVLTLARFTFLAAIGTSIALALIAPYFFTFLYGPEFRASGTICTILLPGVVAFIVFKVLNADLASRGNPWVAMFVMLPTLLCNIGLGWYMIRQDGAIGAAWASTFSYIFAAIGYLILYSRETKIPLREMLLFRRADLDLLKRALPFGKRKKT